MTGDIINNLIGEWCRKKVGHCNFIQSSEIETYAQFHRIMLLQLNNHRDIPLWLIYRGHNSSFQHVLYFLLDNIFVLLFQFVWAFFTSLAFVLMSIFIFLISCTNPFKYLQPLENISWYSLSRIVMLVVY